MSRDLPTDLTNAIEAAVVRPFLAVRIELPDPVYAWTGIGTILFNDAEGTPHSWQGAGEVGSIDAVGESGDGSATGIRVALYKIPAELADDIAAQATRGAVFELYAGALNETYQIVESTALIWKGRLDEYRINDGGDTLSVELAGESRAIDQNRPAIKRFTDEYQQRKYPGDLFFEYVSQMTEVSILWGKAEQSSVITGGGGGGISAGLSQIFST